MQELQNGSLLQNGKYRIVKVLGQGGFGITYEGIQTGLNRRVAIKEFFMKEYCNRDTSTSHISVGTEGSVDMVNDFRQKFLKEAQLIASLEDAPHVVRIHDIFEENNTAYYVMEFLGNGSLNSLLKERGALPEAEAIAYIRQVGEALEFLHNHNTLHLDIKPSNVLLNKKGEVVLIDFGVSKHYDQSGSQTSSTPVGLSKGFAPSEQYQSGGVQQFTPATDIYSLGATLYCLLTGQTPPEASVVFEDGLPPRPHYVSESTWQAITKAMEPRRKDRTQSVAQFIADLGSSTGTAVRQEKQEKPLEVQSVETKVSPQVNHPQQQPVHQKQVQNSDEGTRLSVPNSGAAGFRNLTLAAMFAQLAIETALYINYFVFINNYRNWYDSSSSLDYAVSEFPTILIIHITNLLVIYGLMTGYGYLRRDGKANLLDVFVATPIAFIVWYLTRYHLGDFVLSMLYGTGVIVHTFALLFIFLLMAATIFVLGRHMLKMQPKNDWTQWLSTGVVILVLASFLWGLVKTIIFDGLTVGLFIYLFIVVILAIVMTFVVAKLRRKFSMPKLEATKTGNALIWIQAVGVSFIMSALIGFYMFTIYYVSNYFI